jgi:signal transduction histidine kinase
VTDRLEFARQVVDLRRSQGFDAAQEMTASGQGKQIQDGIRRIVREMSTAENEILRQREKEVRATARFTIAIVTLGAGVALVWAVGVLHFIRKNLRQQHETERVLEETNALHQAVLDGADHAIISGDASGIRLFNRGAERLLGYRADEIVGKRTAEIFHDPKEIARRAEALSAELGRPIAPGFEVFLAKARSGPADENEWTYIRKDGTRVPVLLAVTAMRDATGAVTSFLGIARDIAQRKRAEEALRESHERLALAKERAEAADRIKSAFLATMSHELRTPLNSIIGFTGILLQGLAGPLNSEQNRQLEMVRNSARHLLALINDVLDISKIEAGDLQVHAAPFDLRASIERVAGMVKPLAERKGLALSMKLAPEIGTLVNDQRRVEQVLLNLINNAIKFTERGTVGLTARVAGSQIEIAVSDTGMGIKPDDLATLFQPFRQIDSRLARHHEGTGLGLAISRRLATLMGGDVRAESEWERGSVFTFMLPLPTGNTP